VTVCPIHVHTDASEYDGWATPRELALRCQKVGACACGCTDHGLVANHPEFDRVMRAHGVKPIFGMEAYHGLREMYKGQERDSSHLILLAATDEGLRNLWRLADKASFNSKFKDRVTWETLKEHREGIIATSACVEGLVAKQILADEEPTHLLHYREIFGDDFYLAINLYPKEFQRKINLTKVRFAQEYGIPMIYEDDAHFAGPEDYEYHDAYLAIQSKESIYTPPEERSMWSPPALYIHDEQGVRDSLSYLPEAAVEECLRNAASLGERVSADLPAVRPHLRQYDTEDPTGRFVDLVKRGASNRYGAPSVDKKVRLDHELEVLLDAGLEHYFLMNWDFVEHVKREKITMGVRGSAAGCVVAYCLGLHDVDPFKYQLSFERFYNPGRGEVSFPDIDYDFPGRERKRLYEYLVERYGREYVKQVGMTIRLKPKKAVEKTARWCGITWGEVADVKAILNRVPDIRVARPSDIGWSPDLDPGKTTYVTDFVADDLREWVERQPPDRQPLIIKWLDIASRLCGRVISYAVHPGGVVVSDVPIADEAPGKWNARQKVSVTQFPVSEIDARLLLKLDFLGVRNLETLDEWLRLRNERGFDWAHLEDQQHPDELWALAAHGHTLGIFQIEEGYARDLCMRIKPRTAEDLGVIVALNRPGPIRAGTVDRYIRRRNGEEPVTFHDPILADVWGDTHGVLVYQEQIINLMTKLGYSGAEADDVRRIFAKKKQVEIAHFRDGTGSWAGKGFFGVCRMNGIPHPAIEEIWGDLQAAGKYVFNKSHSVAYGIFAFRTLYAKWKDPLNFIMASIRTNPKETYLYVGEAKRMKIRVLKPDAEHSMQDTTFTSDGRGIQLGLKAIVGIGQETADYFKTLRKKYPEVIQSRKGLYYALAVEQQQWKTAKALEASRGKKIKAKSPNSKFDSAQVLSLVRVGLWDRVDPSDRRLETVQQWEKKYLKVVLTENSQELYDLFAEDVALCNRYSEFELYEGGKRVLYVPGTIINIERKERKLDGKAMGVVTIEYHGDRLTFTVFTREWEQFATLWKEQTVALWCLGQNERGVHFNVGIRLKKEDAGKRHLQED
jgi:DNA polymerase-3 subunit alpha